MISPTDVKLARPVIQEAFPECSGRLPALIPTFGPTRTAARPLCRPILASVEVTVAMIHAPQPS